MANFSLLKAAIDAVIRANGRGEITGMLLNQTLMAMVNSLGKYSGYGGIATPSTSPGTPDQNLFYIATQAGVYDGFDGLTIPEGISALVWNGTWQVQTWFVFDSQPTENSKNLLTSGAVFDAIKENSGIFNLSDFMAIDGEPRVFDSIRQALSESPEEKRKCGMSMTFIVRHTDMYLVVRSDSAQLPAEGTYEMDEDYELANGMHSSEELENLFHGNVPLIQLPTEVGDEICVYKEVRDGYYKRYLIALMQPYEAYEQIRFVSADIEDFQVLEEWVEDKEVPTNVSQLNNDAHYVTKEELESGMVAATAESVTYEELVEKRDNKQLVAGRWYRITDYETIISESDSLRSAGHRFDVIVRADSESTLNENAFAAKRDGDNYFASCKLESWKLKYCLDNDENRFGLANSVDGKGVIYFMADEFGNECDYDFKNIQYLGVTDNVTGTVGNVFYYTFSLVDGLEDENVHDASLNEYIQCYGNKIRCDYGGYNIGHNIIRSTGDDIYYINIGAECGEITITNSQYINIDRGSGNIHINGSWCISIGSDVQYVYITANCGLIKIGNGCQNVGVGRYSVEGDSSNITIGNWCRNIAIGTKRNGVFIGDSSRDISLDGVGSNISLGSFCAEISIGGQADYISIGSDCKKITIGNNTDHIVIGDACNKCIIPDFSISVTIEANCYFIDIVPSYIRDIVVRSGNRDITIESSATTSSENRMKNIEIAFGTNLSNTTKNIVVSSVGLTHGTIYKASDLQEVNV